LYKLSFPVEAVPVLANNAQLRTEHNFRAPPILPGSLAAYLGDEHLQEGVQADVAEPLGGERERDVVEARILDRRSVKFIHGVKFQKLI
jgi:hypothetical protein